MSKPSSNVQLAQAICQLIEAHLEESLTLADLGEHFERSPAQIQRVLKSVLGISPRQYAEACRIERLKHGLKQGRTVTQALFEAGYGSMRQLYERASALLGMTPATYRKGGTGMLICFGLTDCPLGRLLLGATEVGVSAVYLGDEDEELIAELHREYPKATIEESGSHLQDWLGELVAHLEGDRPHLDLPLDVQATAFQWQVWQELQKIPYGSTRTYSEVAEALGQPTASRAVGSACAKNPVSVIVPCHRVLREDGKLGGYRWGLDRKRALLDSEKQNES